LFGLLGSGAIQAEDDHDEHEEGGELSHITMLETEREAKGIVTIAVGLHEFSEELTVPGEVVVNAYNTSQITSRIPAQIINRHVKMGEYVRTGMRLITLSSVEMAAAQGDLVVADREWQRVQKLGRDVVSEARFIQTQVARQQAYAKVIAYGMTTEQADALLKKGDPILATGEFDLLALPDGTVISDNFIRGEVIEPGRVMMEISDESILWVEAKLSPMIAESVKTGTEARIQTGDDTWITGTVIQRYHQLDEITRTQSLRIEIDNSDDMLHPGQFATVAIQSGGSETNIGIPSDAIILMQGNNTVFKLEGDEIHPQVVETGNTRGNWTEIKAGLAQGEEIIVQGAFLFKSLLLKSQIGDHD